MQSNNVTEGNNVVQAQVVQAQPVQAQVVQASVVQADPVPVQGTVVGAPVQMGMPGSAPPQFFGDSPTLCRCQRCNADVTTNVVSKVSTGTHIFALILCAFWILTSGFCCCCCLPYLLPFCKEKQHICPRCNELLGRKVFLTA
mmetsp:Transcript_63114/g.150469  ORF Transcript_63114/g.150469 Transcript_63114/m.150469 type:complete len:143 (+) Transcript_63114:95-523(+)